MNSQQVNYFMAVASNLSFTKTSEELFVSQPAISRQIAMLEKELGVRLFDRNNHSTELTEAGQLYYEFFGQTIMHFRNIQETIRQKEQGIREQIHLGILEGWNVNTLLKTLYDRFSAEHDDADLTINFFSLKELRTLLQTGGIDVALTLRSPLIDANDISCIDCYSSEKIIIFSEDHPVARRAKEAGKELTPSDFRNEQFFIPWDSIEETISKDISGYMSTYGFTPHLKFVHNPTSMISAVRLSRGVSVVNTWSRALIDPQIHHIPLDIRDHICLAWMHGADKEHIPEVAKLLLEITKKQN